MDERYWDDLYGSSGQLFSGNPNPVPVAEAAGLPPGQALDVGTADGHGQIRRIDWRPARSRVIRGGGRARGTS